MKYFLVKATIIDGENEYEVMGTVALEKDYDHDSIVKEYIECNWEGVTLERPNRYELDYARTLKIDSTEEISLNDFDTLNRYII